MTAAPDIFARALAMMQDRVDAGLSPREALVDLAGGEDRADDLVMQWGSLDLALHAAALAKAEKHNTNMRLEEGAKR